MHRPAARTTSIAIVALLIVGAALSWWMARPRTPSPVNSTATPQRVVLFGPNLNEMASVLGHADQLVAITDYCRWPASILDRPRIGGQLDPDLERLAVLRPDLLVLQGESPILRSFADAQGLRIEDVKMDDTIASILDGAVRLDLLLGGDGRRGRTVADSLRAELDAIAARAVTEVERPRVLVVISRDPDGIAGLFTAGAGTFLDELVAVAGGRGWGHGRGRGYFDVALETLVVDPPDVVVEFSADDEPGGNARARAVWERALDPAPRVCRVVFDGAMVPGPRIVETARHLAACIQEGP